MIRRILQIMLSPILLFVIIVLLLGDVIGYVFLNIGWEKSHTKDFLSRTK